jgi:ABC-type multidrug transport system fused ATPase/permease subunit
MNEVLQGMKVLKLYAWELPFIKRIDEIRTKEIKYIKANAKLWTILNFTFSMSPFVITIASFRYSFLNMLKNSFGESFVLFSTFVFMDPKLNLLTPQKVFVSISLFNLLRIPLTLFPMVIKETARMLVSIRRITKFLNAEELSSESIQDTPDENSKVAVEVSKASFTWEDTATPILKDVNVQVPKGSLTAIVGVVGSGKSSLMQGKS